LSGVAKAVAMSLMMNTIKKKSKASSVQPRKAASTTRLSCRLQVCCSAINVSS
jgi:hypothetical protein